MDIISFVDKLDDIVERVEQKNGYVFGEAEIGEVYAYTVRKCELNGKGFDYIPVLFENELEDHVARSFINHKSDEIRRNKKCAISATASFV